MKNIFSVSGYVYVVLRFSRLLGLPCLKRGVSKRRQHCQVNVNSEELERRDLLTRLTIHGVPAEISVDDTDLPVSSRPGVSQFARTPEEIDLIHSLENAAYPLVVALEQDPQNPELTDQLEAIYVQLAPLLVGDASAPLATHSEIANALAELQLPTGAIHYSQDPAGYGPNGAYYLTDVYFSGTALYWALDGTTDSDAELRIVTKNWLDWCFANVEGNGQFRRYFYYPDGSEAKNSIEPDAQDSNSAVILAVLGKYTDFGGSVDFINTPEMKAKLEQIADVMTALQQPNGLTWNNFEKRVAYTEDQSEVFRGLLAMSRIEAEVYHDLENARVYADAAGRVQSAVMDLLYDDATGLFDWALGSSSDLSEDWYPNTISQVWPMLYGLISPMSPISQSTLSKITSTWSGNQDPRMNWQQRLDSASVAMAFWMGNLPSPVESALVTLAQTPYPLSGYPLYVTTSADMGWTLSLIDVDSRPAPINYFPRPVVTGLSRTNGSIAGGTTLTITGSDLNEAAAVYVGTQAVTILDQSATAITIISPPGNLGVVDIRVLTKGGISKTSEADRFSYNGLPVLTGVSPSSGPPSGGTVVTLNGTNLSGATAVLFGDMLVDDFVSNTATQLVVLSPGGAEGIVDVRVVIGNASSPITAPATFSYRNSAVLTVGGPAAVFSNNRVPINPLLGADVQGGIPSGGRLTISMNAVGTRKKSIDILRFPSASSIGTPADPTYSPGLIKLEISLNDAPTAVSVQELLRGINFSTRGRGMRTASRQLSVQLFDSTGNLEATMSQTILVRSRTRPAQQLRSNPRPV